ncbi:MAG: NAD(P)-dependent alcohol dehydrogenase [Rickettsiales bacterium]|nr:NAD(P)-dependent alcohol dehydrogenase [Rickettsiales bacterium]
MTTHVHALALKESHGKLQPYEFAYEGDLQPHQLEVEVLYCGVCHSDLSMANNDWGMTQYPLVPGHEIIGRVSALGEEAASKGLAVGQNVGIGWFTDSCLHCHPCLSGDHNLCTTGEQTIVGRPGGFASKIRCGWIWATPLPASLDLTKAGPLFCGGITVFNPIIQNEVRPTQRVGVVGIGGLGHLALQFLNKWGCEVTAFTSSDSKTEEAKQLGAHHVVNSRNGTELEKIAGSLDFILNTANADLDWNALLAALAPKGRFVTVGAVPNPIAVPAFALIAGQKSVGGSPLGSPATVQTMLEFCGRHGIAPVTEHFNMSEANEAFAHLEAGKARYRIVLKNDLN